MLHTLSISKKVQYNQNLPPNLSEPMQFAYLVIFPFLFAHLCCSCCLPPAKGSRVGRPGWQRCACAGSWWSAGWRRPCPAGWWWPQAEAASWPAQRTRNSPFLVGSEPHCETFLYASSGDWGVRVGWGRVGVVLKVKKTRRVEWCWRAQMKVKWKKQINTRRREKNWGANKWSESTLCKKNWKTGDRPHIMTTYWPLVDWFMLCINDLSINPENSFHKYI